MSEENVRLVRSLYEGFGRGDVPGVLATMDPQIEWNEAENFVYADRNPYVGPAAILEGVFARLGSEWDGFTATSEELLDAGDTVVSTGRYGGVYKRTGGRVHAQFVHVFRVREGKIVKFQQYVDTLQMAKVVAG